MREHLFQREHVIAGPPTGALRDGHFAPMNHIAELWQLAESGEINLPENQGKAEHFHRLVAHEHVESRLMEAGMPYRAHGPEMWGDGVYFPRRDQHGAHDIAPLEYNYEI
ncbi:hypothetical protein ACFWTE_27660 [Nocardiopsis sp. NPDC058631]|uniref:hypothetical protein n=1 Tax=Nocardiopsis sp. NPDC058631 TaxID=3346566 RepID=UPI003669CDFA